MPTAAPPIPLASPTSSTAPGQALQIAYTKNGDINLWTEGTGPARLTNFHDVVALKVSGDGTLIAFQRQDPIDYYFMELWVVNTAGTPDPRLLVSHADLMEILPPDPAHYIHGAGINAFTWQPQTHEVAYGTVVLPEGAGYSPRHDIRLVNADTLAKTTLFDAGQGGLFYYSPDGSHIALSNPGSISLVNSDGSDLHPQVLIFPRVITYSEYEYHAHPTWTKNSQFLLVAIPPHDPLAQPRQPTGLWRIPASGAPAELLRYIPAISFAWPNNGFSPDSRQVAYVEEIGQPQENRRELRIGTLDGSNETAYAQGESLEFMGWLPDSRHFSYVVHAGDNKGVFIGDTNGQPVELNRDPEAITGIQWIDGSRFAYLESNEAGWKLKISDVDGNTLGLVDTITDSSPVFEVVQAGE